MGSGVNSCLFLGLPILVPKQSRTFTVCSITGTLASVYGHVHTHTHEWTLSGKHILTCSWIWPAYIHIDGLLEHTHTRMHAHTHIWMDYSWDTHMHTHIHTHRWMDWGWQRRWCEWLVLFTLLIMASNTMGKLGGSGLGIVEP